MKLVDQLATAGLVIGARRSQRWDERRIRDYRERSLAGG